MIPFRDDVKAKRYPIVTILIILANLGVFLYELSLPSQDLGQLIVHYGVVPAEPSSLPLAHPITMLTAMFLHGGWFHLIGNMWFLWIFGDNIEDRMGHMRFLFFYLLCGLIASGAHILSAPQSTVPSIGASGAVAGVLGAYLVSYPLARILTLIPLFLIWPIVELPAIVVLGSWFLIQLFNGTSAVAATLETEGGIAWWAHVGGFLAGMVLVGVFARRPVQRYSW
jgi:membrane associated rhomboid family serine protease